MLQPNLPHQGSCCRVPHSPAPLFEVPEQAVISLAAKRTDSTPEAARPEGLELPTAGADSLRQAPVHPAVELGGFTAFLISTLPDWDCFHG